MSARHSLPGILGVVSEILIAQDDRANAISSALQASIYHIVTKDEASAREAIGYLKRNRSGSPISLPLDIMRPRYPSKEQQIIASQSKGYLGWANESVSC